MATGVAWGCMGCQGTDSEIERDRDRERERERERGGERYHVDQFLRSRYGRSGTVSIS